MSRPGDSTERSLVVFGFLGLMVLATALGADTPRFWANWLVWFVFLLSVGLGSLFIVALEHLVGALWSVPIRRVPERLAGLIVPIVPVALIALLSLPAIYPWARPEAARSAIVAAKAAWLNVPFFVARVVGCLLAWLVAYHILVGGSLAQDTSRDPKVTVRCKRFAPVFMAIFALTVTLVAFDWISSLEPEWYSDIFGVYLFAGIFLSGLAATSLGVAHLVERGRLPGVKPDHLYNLGCFLFAFTVFWSYIAFAQYLLMWYANLPEEVFWYKHRIEGPWQGVTLALALVHFVIPFLALMPRGAKCDLARLRQTAVVVLIGHFLDLYWLIFPSIGSVPVLAWTELGAMAFFGSAALIWVRRAMHRGADMPVGDPFLAEGLAFHL